MNGNIKIAESIKTKLCRKKLTPDLESVAKNYTDLVKKGRATENEKKFLTSVINLKHKNKISVDF